MKAIVILGGLLILAGCQPATEPKPEVQTPYTQIAYGPNNSSNPYDSIGIQHNDAVEHIFQFYDTDDTTAAACFAAISDGILDLHSGKGINDQELLNHLDTVKQYIEDLFQSDIVAYFVNYSDTMVYTLEEVNYIHQIGEIYRIHDDIGDIKSALTQLETQMLNESWSSSSTLYATFPVLKHSLYYWDDFYEGLGKRKQKPLTKPMEPMKQIIINLHDWGGAGAGHKAAADAGYTKEDTEYWVLVGLYQQAASKWAAVMIEIETTLPPLRD